MARSNTWKRKYELRKRRRERRRAVQQAKRNRPLASRIKDPFEIVLRVLMVCGLSMELARKVVFESGSPLWMTPTAHMMKKCMSGFEMFDHQRHHVVTGGMCLCQWHEHGDLLGHAAAMYCRGMTTEIGRETPISLAAACHSQTIYQWRGTHQSRHYEWIMRHHDWTWGQLWGERFDQYCGMTLLYYRLWRTMNDRTNDEEFSIEPREYSLVRRLKEAEVYNELIEMLQDATGDEHANLRLLKPGYRRAEIVQAIIAAN